MSQRGRGSGPYGDDPDGEDAARERTAADYPPSQSGSRPIAPYDPYRPRADDALRRPTRDIIADPYGSMGRSSRVGSNDPFLPDDDPLNAEAWQLELDDLAAGDEGLDEPLPDFEREEIAPPRRARRQPPSSRSRREAGARQAAGRAAQRSRTGAAGRARIPRGTITVGVPQVVTGSTLAADTTALLLLGINAASFVIMALLVGLRLGGLPSPIVLQLNAAGNPSLWGPPSMLWHLPVMSFFLMVMFVVVAWFLHPADRFAARFALAASLVVHLLAWVAVFQHLA